MLVLLQGLRGWILTSSQVYSKPFDPVELLQCYCGVNSRTVPMGHWKQEVEVSLGLENMLQLHLYNKIGKNDVPWCCEFIKQDRVEFRMLAGGNKANGRITTTDFRGEDFDKLRCKKEVCKRWKMEVKQPRRNIDTVRVCRDETNPTWSWIWQRTWRAKRRAAIGTTAAKGRLKKMWVCCQTGMGIFTKSHGEDQGHRDVCTSIFTGKTSLQAPETRRSVWSKENLLFVKEVGHTQVPGTWWEAPTSAEEAGQCHCEASLYYLWKIMVVGKVSILS